MPFILINKNQKRSEREIFMEYYRYMFKETISAISDFCACMTRLRTENIVYFCLIFSFVVLVLFGIVLLIMTGFCTHQLRIGTDAFWVTIIIWTMGVAIIPLLCLCKALKSNFVIRQPVRSLVYTLFPSICVIGSMLITQRYYTTIEMTPYLAVFVGFIGFIAEIIWSILNPQNKTFFIQVIKGFSDRSSLSNFTDAMREARASLIKIPKDINPFDRAVRTSKTGSKYRVFIEADLEDCLLLEEVRKTKLERIYKKPDGNRIKVIEIESLVSTKIWNSLAGLMLMVMLNTPYISYMIHRVISRINELI